MLFDDSNAAVLGRQRKGKTMIGNKETMAKNIKSFLERDGITAKDLATEINVPPTTVYSWIQGVSYPRIDNIELMANFFKVGKADLVEDQEELLNRRLEEAFTARPEMKILFSVAKNCTKEEIDQAIRIIEALKNG